MTMTTDEGRCTCAIGQPCTCGTYSEVENRIYLSGPPVAVPCPDWCTDRLGHGYDMYADDEGHECRFHGHRFGESGDVSADVLADGVFRDYSETVGPARIVVWISGNSHHDDISDPEQARRLARHLLEAADLLESLQETQS